MCSCRSEFVPDSLFLSLISTAREKVEAVECSSEERHVLNKNKEEPVVLFIFISLFLSASFKDTLLNDIRKARDKYQGEELAKELSRIKLRIDNTEVLTQDIVMNLLFSYRDIQVCVCHINTLTHTYTHKTTENL